MRGRKTLSGKRFGVPLLGKLRQNLQEKAECQKLQEKAKGHFFILKELLPGVRCRSRKPVQKLRRRSFIIHVQSSSRSRRFLKSRKQDRSRNQRHRSKLLKLLAGL